MVQTAAARTVSATGDAIEQLLDEIAAAGGPQVTALAEDLVRELSALYGDGLARIIAVTRESGAGAGEKLLESLAGDPLVAGLLSLHDLHPEAPRARIERALERVRPYLGSHGGGVELLEIDERCVVHLRLAGSCDGCASSAATLEYAIRGAVLDAAPEVVAIAVETPDVRPAGEIIPLQAIGRDERRAAEWSSIDTLPQLTGGRLTGALVGGRALVFARAGAQLYAYADRCPGCGASMDGALLDGSLAACAECGRAYALARAGRCADGTLQLEPIPLLEDEGGARVALPQGER
jgi:Fe-S cluster biogenesis protein NfuA/nitrite reductase/ring-hydroxylating ferredoxin subunit